MAQPEHPHGVPPGQSGEHPDNPAEADDVRGKPDTSEDELEPTHPIVLPEDEPQVEHHEGEEPDKEPV